MIIQIKNRILIWIIKIKKIIVLIQNTNMNTFMMKKEKLLERKEKMILI